ncbi:hypothetical protein [Micromonospora sp. NPDC093244]|uniref:hypothetical protein n=1 Tax=Micromonospora sp. NPDC093244 TaxID=3155071 RepID=UPI0034195590
MSLSFGRRVLVPAALVAVTAAGCATGQPAAGSSPASPGTVAAPTTVSPPPATVTSRPSAPAATTASATGCPVTAATLNRVPGLPEGYRINPDRVQCWKGWATGWDPDQQGDGAYLFRHTPTHGWRIHSQGSSFSCTDLGITIDPNDPPGICS